MNARPRVLAALAVVVIALSGAAFGGALLSPVAHATSTPAPLSSATATVAHAPSAPASSPSSVPTPTLKVPGPAAEAKLQAAIHASHVDLQKIYPPNLLYAPKMSHGMVVAPSYPQAPEPAGLADYGVNNSTGTPTSFTINTQSYRSSVSLNSVLPYYLSTGVPEGFTSQMNVVVNNITLFGNSSYTFWAQNVFFYDAYSGQLFVENNIWNFSAPPPAPQPVDTFFVIPGYTNGSDNPSIGYYAAGTPTFNGVTTPFEIVFYINTTTLLYQGTEYSEIDFAFNVLFGGVQVFTDQFDRALFNNTGGGSSIPTPMIHVDGTNITPTGFIPYDAEVMLGGPGGGSTATFQGINATMTLQHLVGNLTSGTYVNEPSAWSSGSETGETAVGIAEYYDSSGTVHLGAGPEFIQPFWNSSATATAGAATITGTISPSNAWAFVSQGSSYSTDSSAWAPLPPGGAYAWNLTSGSYTVKLMESDYDAVTSSPMAVASGVPTFYNVSMTLDMSQGVYTPLYAWDNAQLAAIASSGTGTSASPYVLFNNEIGALAPEFATFNDYAFPSYPGISLVDTTAYVDIANPASFLVNYWGTYANFANHYDVPLSNNLPIWLFQTSHVSIVGGSIQGWFSSNQNGFPYANVVVWNATSTLITGVTFGVSVNAIWTYGGTGNSFVGNVFNNQVVNGNLMVPSAYFYLGSPYFGIFATSLGPTGLIENEGGDAIWNNYFAVDVTAYESNVNVYDDLYPSVPQVFTNDWNLTGATPVPASTVFTINGVPVTGSTSGNATVCGNWWWNYIAGSALPYENPYPGEVPYYEGTGNIITGGDYCPAGPAYFNVTFSESGLPAGTEWGFTLLTTLAVTLPIGGTAALAVPSLTIALPVGLYEVVYNSVANYSVSPQADEFEIASNGEILGMAPAVYAPMPGVVVFGESGLPAGTSWSVGINSGTLSGSTSTLSTSLSFGSYAYTVGSVAGYTASSSGGNVLVTAGGTTIVNIVFTAQTPAAGTLAGTVTPSTATVWVNGVQQTLTSGAFSVSLAPGTYAVVAADAGYYSYYNNYTVTSSTTTSVTIALNPTSAPVTGNGTLSVTVKPGTAKLWVNGVLETLTSGVYQATVTAGNYAIETNASGYYNYYTNVTVAVGGTGAVVASMNPLVTQVVNHWSNTTTSSSGISSTGWAIIGVLALLTVIFLITTVIYMGRAGRARGGNSSGGQTGGGSS